MRQSAITLGVNVTLASPAQVPDVAVGKPTNASIPRPKPSAALGTMR